MNKTTKAIPKEAVENLWVLYEDYKKALPKETVENLMLNILLESYMNKTKKPFLRRL